MGLSSLPCWCSKGGLEGGCKLLDLTLKLLDLEILLQKLVS